VVLLFLALGGLARGRRWNHRLGNFSAKPADTSIVRQLNLAGLFEFGNLPRQYL
jgi:hypothetical protein